MATGRILDQHPVVFWMGVAGLTIGVIGIPLGILQPEVRCGLHLDDCRSNASTPPAAIGSYPSDFPPAPVNHRLPYQVVAPTGHQARGNHAPSAQLAFVDVVNLGAPVGIPISGTYFTSNDFVQIDIYRPGGASFSSFQVETDERGLFSSSILWYPLKDAGTEGNAGLYKVEVTDSSGQTQTIGFNVRTTADTPPVQTWTDFTDLQATDRQVSAATSGSLCGSTGAQLALTGDGFAPGSVVDIHYLRPDGLEVAGESGVVIDGLGNLNTTLTYWATTACQSRRTFEYRVVVVDGQTQVESIAILSN